MWHDLPGAEGIAIDWVGRKMYWVDNKNDKMYVSELNGTSRRTMIETDMSNPRAIVAHPAKGSVHKICHFVFQTVHGQTTGQTDVAA